MEVDLEGELCSVLSLEYTLSQLFKSEEQSAKLYL